MANETDDLPATPIAGYTQIIDQIVAKTRPSTSAEWIIEKGIFSNAPAEKSANQFVKSLNPSLRKQLAKMLQDERDDAIHDTLALLTWWIECGNVLLTYKGKPIFKRDQIPIGVSGVGMHGDFIARRDGWTWPKDAAPGSGLHPPDHRS